MAEDTRTDEPEKDETEDAGEEPTEARLEELEGHIEQARRDSDEALKGSFYESDHSMFEELEDTGPETFADSGEEAREDPSATGVESKSDDQNIAP